MKDMDKFIAQQRLLYPLSDESVRKLTEGMEEVFAPKAVFRCMKEVAIRMFGRQRRIGRSFVERVCAMSPCGSCRPVKS